MNICMYNTYARSSADKLYEKNDKKSTFFAETFQRKRHSLILVQSNWNPLQRLPLPENKENLTKTGEINSVQVS
jgi:hypothetical protein